MLSFSHSVLAYEISELVGAWENTTAIYLDKRDDMQPDGSTTQGFHFYEDGTYSYILHSTGYKGGTPFDNWGSIARVGRFEVIDNQVRFYDNHIRFAINGDFSSDYVATNQEFTLRVEFSYYSGIETNKAGLRFQSLDSDPLDFEDYMNLWYRGATESGTMTLYGSSTPISIPGFNAPVVPEPKTWAMLLVGLGMMGTVAHRRKKQA